MRKRPWLLWLIVWAALHLCGLAVGWLLIAQAFRLAGVMVWGITFIAGYLWLLGGAFYFAQPRWLLWTILHLGAAVVAAGVAFSFYAFSTAAALVVIGVAVAARGALLHRAFETRLAWRWPAIVALGAYDVLALAWLCIRATYYDAADVILGASTMTVVFAAGLWLIRLILSPGIPILGVARTLIDEAIRMRIAVIFIVIMLLVVPILPYTSDPEELLRYRVGTFLAWSLWGVALALGFMTVFLACGTITSELRERQIYFTLTKPLSRGQYLLGKWLGIVLLNALLLSVAGIGIYAYARGMERMASDPREVNALRSRVLVARAAVTPTPPAGMRFEDMVAAQLRTLQMERGSEQLSDRDRVEAIRRAEAQWHTVPRWGEQTYRFTGLLPAKETSPELQLKLKPNASDPPEDDRVWFQMRINDRPYEQPGILHLSLQTVHVLPISTAHIDPQGELSITVVNLDPRGRDATRTDISFDREEGLELYYRYGSFGPNLARGLVILWMHLGFIAMVGLAAGTVLGFPVACLLTMMVYLTSIVSGFLAESLSTYGAVVGQTPSTWEQIIKYPVAFWNNLVSGQLWPAAKVVIQALGNAWTALVPSFSQYDPIGQIADGRVVQPRLVARTVLMVGVLWTGIAGLIGWALFRRRELARVTV